MNCTRIHFIYRPIGTVKLENITNPTKVIASGTRSFGVGGIFGYFNGDDVKIKSNHKTYLFSPENSIEFIRNFEQGIENQNNE